MSSRFIMPFADVGSGIKPSSGAKLFFYELDGVTLKNTYSDQLSTPTANTNPVISDSNGVFGDIYIDGSYKVTLQNKNGTQAFGGAIVEELGLGALINDLSQAYEFPTVAAYKAFTIVFPVGKIINLLDRGASFTIIAGTGTATGNRIIASDEVSQSAELRIQDYINLKEFGAIVGDVTTSSAIAEAFTYQNTLNVPIKIPATGSATQYEVNEQLDYYGYGIYGDGRYNTKLKSSYIGVLIKKMNSNDEGRIKDFTVLGTGVVGVDDGIGDGYGPDGVIGMGDDGSGAGWSRTQMVNVHWRHMAQQFEIQKSLWCIFDTVYARFVKRGAFFVGGGAGWNSTWFNNAITFINCLWDDTGEYAVDYVGSNLALSGTNTFQSGVDGLRINRDPAGRSNNNTIENLYTEFNSGSDIVLDGVKLTLGTVQYQGGSGTVAKPNTLNNILASNSDIIATGRPSILDTQVNRITLTSGSTYTALYPEIVSGKNTADTTSEFIYIPDRIADKTIEDVFADLSASVPVEISGGNLSTRSWAITLEAPNGEFTSFTLDVGLVVSSYRMLATGLQVVAIDNNNFQVNFATTDYTFTQSAPNGTITIVANVATLGDVTLRMVQRVSKSVPTY
tara:strand:+ start:262 stop:2118 length:1857 start_codon:yes stop_codon:yes gene_type:complete